MKLNQRVNKAVGLIGSMVLFMTILLFPCLSVSAEDSVTFTVSGTFKFITNNSKSVSGTFTVHDDVDQYNLIGMKFTEQIKDATIRVYFYNSSGVQIGSESLKYSSSQPYAFPYTIDVKENTESIKVDANSASYTSSMDFTDMFSFTFDQPVIPVPTMSPVPSADPTPQPTSPPIGGGSSIDNSSFITFGDATIRYSSPGTSLFGQYLPRSVNSSDIMNDNGTTVDGVQEVLAKEFQVMGEMIIPFTANFIVNNFNPTSQAYGTFYLSGNQSITVPGLASTEKPYSGYRYDSKGAYITGSTGTEDFTANFNYYSTKVLDSVPSTSFYLSVTSAPLLPRGAGSNVFASPTYYLHIPFTYVCYGQSDILAPDLPISATFSSMSFIPYNVYTYSANGSFESQVGGLLQDQLNEQRQTNDKLDNLDKTLKDEYEEEKNYGEESGQKGSESLDQITNTLSTWEILTLPFKMTQDLFDAIYNGSGEASITFPGFQIMGYMVWEDYTFSFESISGEFSVLFDALHIVTGILEIIGVIYFCYHTYQEIVFGTGDQ